MELMCKTFFYDEIHYRYFCVVTFEWTDFKLSMNSGFFFCSIGTEVQNVLHGTATYTIMDRQTESFTFNL
jgi:hypothetical protein